MLPLLLAAASASPVAVVGGQPSAPGHWPEVVAIYNINDEMACTGTLVQPDLVLTAGHCGSAMETVHVGSHDLVADPGEVYDIVEGWVHPDFYATYDAALFRLDRPVEGITPPALIADCWATDYLLDNAEAVIVGFGAIDAYAAERPTALHEATVPVTDADCAEAARGCNPDVLPGGELIAGGDGVDTCSGDSGGPLFLETPEGRLLAGITSRAAEPVRQPCGDGGIYVRADAIVEWIEEVADTTLPRPDCEQTNRAPTLLTPALRTTRLQPLRVELEAADPNPDQAHRFDLIDQPDFGRAFLDGGELSFLPDGTSHGVTAVGLRITDDGVPPRAIDVSLPLTVLDVEVTIEERGCSQIGGAPWWLVWLPLLALSRRER